MGLYKVAIYMTVLHNIEIDKCGTKRYFLNNVLHREDGPAIEYVGGIKEWYKNGDLHRENGPAIECPNGDTLWYKDGKLHREDGPAIEYIDGYLEWRFNDELYGVNNDFTNESWQRFIKTLIFS